jgi:hypothetical protein
VESIGKRHYRRDERQSQKQMKADDLAERMSQIDFYSEPAEVSIFAPYTERIEDAAH